MNYENSVTVSGLLHHLSRNRNDSYFPFSIRHENLWTDGTTRKDFLTARAFSKELCEKLKALDENAPIKVTGVLKSSKGSGEMYLDVRDAEILPELGQPVNTVKLSGAVHVIKAKNEGENATGKYTRFAVRQEDPEKGRDFIVVRVYDDDNNVMRGILAGKSDNDPVTVEGTLRSSRGSGENYVRCGKLE